MELKLIVVSGKANKDAVTLKPPIVIGRSRQAELTVAHPMISRRHCEIFETDGLIMIRDLGSLNGTVVEGQRIKESPLCPGNEFSLGPLTFRAEYDYQGDLDSLPAPKIADELPPQPQVQSDQEAPASQTTDETPHFPQVDAPVGGQLPNFDAWDQMATGAAGEPDEQHAVVEIEELTEVKDEEEEEPEQQQEEEEEPEPTPPPPPRLRQQTTKAAPKPPGARGDDDKLGDFFKGVP